jgi:hypothetical protein
LRSFSTQGTVVVPDRGSTLMGGIHRAQTGRNEFGVPMLPLRPFKNAASGMTRSASSVRVTAWIHDFEAMDEYLLNQPTAFRAQQAAAQAQGPLAMAADARPQVHVPPTALPSTWAAQRPADSAVMSLAEAKADRARQLAQRSTEAVALFEKGQQAESDGKPAVAKVYYRMAAKRATGALQLQVEERIAALDQRKDSDSRVAQAGS